ncbi:MAG: hypothetical protein QM831_27310 [Kofleriaceae bacterium]
MLALGCQNFSNYQQSYLAPTVPWTRVAQPAGPPVDGMATEKCHTPTHDDEYYGFSVGHPEGWSIDYSTGTILVQRDPTVGAMIFPARIRRADVTPDQVADLFANAIGSRVRQAGGTFELVDKTSDGRVATALVLAQVNGMRIKGPLQVIATPGFMTLKVYWAPESELAADEPQLRQVMTCFKRKTVITQKTPAGKAGAMKVGAVGHAPKLAPYRDRYFAMQIVPGLEMTSESEHGFDMVNREHTMGAGFGYVLNPTIRADIYATQTLQQYFPNAQIVTQGWKQAPQGWLAAEIEWRMDTPQHYMLHGVIRVTQTQGVMMSFGYQTGDVIWDKTRPALEAMMNSVQIQPAAVAQVQAGIRAQMAQYPPIQSSSSSSSSSDAWNQSVRDRWESQDRRNQGFDDAILGQDHTRSPSTGETYVVPNNAWSDTGPQGAGYYRQLPGGGVERLDVQGTDYQ